MPDSPRTFEPPFIDVPGALAEIRAGRMIVVVDDEDRENEGDLTMASEFVTPEAINFMARFGRGLICMTLTEERADYLRLFPMTQQNSSRFGTAFTETIEAREGVTTGISAADRAHTIRTAIDDKSNYADLARPGHVFPLRARKGGVLVRAGQTEASVDLARMAGLSTYQFEQRMRRIFQITPGQFIHKVRMESAVRRLRETGDPIARLAQESGYSDQSAFSRHFKQTVGLSPAQYRRSVREAGASGPEAK